MKKLIPILGLIFLFSTCSIIDDEDITDPNVDLKLNSVDINQTTQDGSRDLGGGTSQFTNDGKIASIIWNVSSGDFAFRTGTQTSSINGRQNIYSSDATGTVKTFFDLWDSQDRLTRMHNEVGGQLFEAYIFGYDSRGRLASMITIYGDAFDPCMSDPNLEACTGLVLIMSDSLVYTSSFGNKVDYIKRNVLEGKGFRYQEAIYVGYGDQFSNVSEEDIAALALKRFGIMDGVPTPESTIFDEQQQNLTSNRSIYTGFGYGFWNMRFLPDSFGSLIFAPFVQGKITASVKVEDFRFGENRSFNGDQSRLPDIYYFHPFLLFPGFFKNGDDLASVYFNDWWILNPELDPSFTFRQNRQMIFNFNYTK